MNKAYALHELQKVDLMIEGKEEDLAQVMGRLGDDAVLREQRQALAEMQSRVDSLEKRRQSLDWEGADLQAKIDPLDKKLYSGQVKAPKELLALQQDVDMLKGQHRQLEDAELEVMIELEEAQRQLRQMAGKLAELEGKWAEEQQDLSTAKEALLKELEALRAQRVTLAGQIDALALDAYQRVREQRQHVAVVTVERGTCSGCHIAIPAIEIQRARVGRELVFCQSCGRILFVA